MNELKIQDLQKLCNDDTVVITQHMAYRLQERGIKYHDIINAIMNGEIIEQYPKDYPHPSCLVFGISLNSRILHVVCGTDGIMLWIITAYYPTTEKWNDDLKTQKGCEIK